MGLAKILALLKPKPKPRPIYVGEQIVGWDDGLPNSVKIDRVKLIEGILGRSIGKAYFASLIGIGRCDIATFLTTIDDFADIAFATCYATPSGVSTGGAYHAIRDRYKKTLGHERSDYWSEMAVARATSDMGLWKSVAGTDTQLGTEAVDLTAEESYPVCLQAVGTTIKLARTSARPVMPTVEPYIDPDVAIPSGDWRISVTDTSIAYGGLRLADIIKRYTPSTYWGAATYFPSSWVNPFERATTVKPPSSPTPEPLAYFEMPIEFYDLPEVNEDGTINVTTQFYGVKMPEEIVTVEKPIPQWVQRKVEVLRRKGWSDEEIKAFMPEAFPVERINRLAVTWSALIPTDSKGKPTTNTALVRVFHSSPEYVHPIEKRIQAIKEMRGVRQLSREEAISLALKMDDKLHIHDLVPCTKHDLGGKCFQEYRDWRIYTVGDKPEFADTDIRKRYVKETKGW